MSTSAPLPNFERAEFHSDPPAPDRCSICQRGIVDQYFRVGGHLACATCAQQAQSVVLPDSHKAYSRALFFGIGAAIAACIGYALMQLTGFMIGYVAVGVGWLIGKAMQKGSRGRGGRRYQITAAILTYAAISIAMVPAIIVGLNKEHKSTPTAQQASNTPTPSSKPVSSSPKPSGVTFGQFILACLILIGIGLVSPFLTFTASLAHGLFTMLFLFLGIQAAVALTKKTIVDVDGPFDAVVR